MGRRVLFVQNKTINNYLFSYIMNIGLTIYRKENLTWRLLSRSLSARSLSLVRPGRSLSRSRSRSRSSCLWRVSSSYFFVKQIKTAITHCLESKNKWKTLLTLDLVSALSPESFLSPLDLVSLELLKVRIQ